MSGNALDDYIDFTAGSTPRNTAEISRHLSETPTDPAGLANGANDDSDDDSIWSISDDLTEISPEEYAALEQWSAAHPDLSDLRKGRVFQSKVEAKAAIVQDSLRQGGASCEVIESSTHALIMACLERGVRRQCCPYRAYFLPMVEADLYTLKTFYGSHICSVDSIPPRSMSKQAWFIKWAVSNALRACHTKTD